MAGRSDANTPHSGEPDDELGELDNILADLQDESEKYGAGTKAKRKKPEKLVRWKKRDHYGRLIAETRQSSGGAGPSSHPKDTCPVHMDPCPDDASNYAPLQVQLQEAHKALEIISQHWPGNASGSPRQSWSMWPGKGKSGAPCLSCSPRDPTPDKRMKMKMKTSTVEVRLMI
ncbi:unnamed protein product [Boreogadus saida]